MNNRLYFIWGLLAAVLIFVGIIFPPTNLYYNGDELFIIDSGLFLLYGSTPKILEWPASPLFGLYFIYHIIEVVAGVLQSKNIESVSVFESFDFSAFSYLIDPSTEVYKGRILNGICTLIIVFISLKYLFGIPETKVSYYTKVLVALLLVSCPIAVQSSWILRPDSIPFFLWVYLLLYSFFGAGSTKRYFVLASFLFGLLLSIRLTYLPGAILIIGIIIEKEKWKVKPVIEKLFFSACIIALTFYLLCPFVFTDIFTFLKSFIGNILSKRIDSSGLVNWSFIAGAISNAQFIIYIAVVTAGMVTSYKYYGKLKTIILLFLFLAFLQPVVSSTTIVEHYFLPIYPLIFITLVPLFENILPFLKQRKLVFVLFIGCTIATINLYSIYERFNASHRQTNFRQTVSWAKENLPDNALLILDPAFEDYFIKNEIATRQILEKLQNVNLRRAKLKQMFTSITGADIDYSNVLMESTSFDEEDLMLTKYKILSKYIESSAVKSFNIEVYNQSMVSPKAYYISFEDAMTLYKSTPGAFFITPLILEGVVPVKIFESRVDKPLFVYRN